jgi:hypothetical protein
VWTGEEVLVIGGRSEESCSRNGDCATPVGADLADGAAYDPASGSWRPIADAPRPLSWAQSAVVDDAVYLYDGAEPALLRYDVDADAWDEVATPFRDPDWWSMAAVPGGLVTYLSSEEAIERPAFVLDGSTGEWTEVPPDPLSKGFDRSVAATADGWVLFDKEIPPTSDAERGPVRAVAYDPASATWERLPDAEIQDSWPFHEFDGRLVNALIPVPDGGGTMHPRGAILDLADRTWSDLPAVPEGDALGGGNVVAGGRAFYGEPRGLVLDMASDRWVEIPPLLGEPQPNEMSMTDRHTFTAAGRDLFVFGGTRWAEDGVDYEMLDDAWMWSPPA